MRVSALSVFALSTALFSSPFAAGQSSTPVIGYYKFDVPAGNSMWVSGFVAKKEFQGQATSVAGGAASSVITQSGATWTSGGFANHYVEILDGAWAGLVLDILSNTATTVTVKGNLGAAGFNVAQNVAYAIRAHATLGTIYKNGAGLTAFEDQINLYYDNGSRKTFYYDDTAPGHIVADDFSTIKDDERVYPGQGMLLITGGQRQLTFGGGDICYVKETPTKIPLYGGKINLVGVISPVVNSAPLVGPLSSIEQAPIGSATVGLADSGLSPFEDEILPYRLAGGVFSKLGTFYYDDGADTIVDSNFITSTAPVPFGTAMVIKPSGDRYYTQPGVVVSN